MSWYNRYYEKIGKEVKDITEEIDFELPNGWELVRLPTICWLDDANKTSGEKLPYLDARTLRGKSEKTYLTDGKIVDVGTKVILVDGENSGEVFDVPYRGYMGSTFKILGASHSFNFDYLSWILYFYKDDFKGNKKGAAIPHLNKDLFKSIIVGVPPITEQIRIINRINDYESLLAEYDRLEQQATKLDDEIYDKLKKSILQYAIQGKLVPQDENDEPASVLLERIRAEKKAKLGKKYVESYIYKGDDNCYYEKIKGIKQNITDEITFNIPCGWTFARVDSLFYIQTGASFKKEQATSDKSQIRVLRGGNILQGEFHFCDSDIYIDSNLIAPSILLCKNDLITPAVTSIENVGKFALIDRFYEKVTAGGFVFILRPYYNDDILTKYLYYALQSSYFIKQMKTITKKSGQAFYNIGKERLVSLLVPIPSYLEQKRIVQRIEKILNTIKGEV